MPDAILERVPASGAVAALLRPEMFETRRLGEPARREDPNRNAFLTDGDRITFSRPFRRLQQKTQVHPLITNAHVRNRLVHTLEVAAVGRSLGYAVGARLRDPLAAIGRIPDDLGYLVGATCLAHDIGNPPFGHAGEEVIAAHLAHWLDTEGHASGLPLDNDLRFFDGNAQGFRVLVSADGRRGRGGLQLTMATLAAFLKYPWDAFDPRAARDGRAGVKFNVFDTERDVVAEALASTALRGPHPRHPAVWLMEAADDVVYTLTDLEDAVELGILRFDDLRELVQPLAAVTDARLAEMGDVTERLALLRSSAVGRLVEAMADSFCAHLDLIAAGALEPHGGLTTRLGALSEPFAAAVRRNEEVVYFHPRKVEFEIGAHDVLAKALDVFLPACLAWARAGGDEARLGLRERQAVSLLQDYRPRPGMSASEAIRCAVDFVAGMTDGYAGWLSARLRGLDLSSR